MLNAQMTINGKGATASAHIEVVNPATGAVFASVPDAQQAELEAALAAARASLPAWRALPYAERAQLMQKIAVIIRENADELGHLLTNEQGKPLSAAAFEIESAAQWALVTSTLELPVAIVEDTPDHLIETRQVPIGVVGAISPWNFPVLLSMWKIVPALLTGNTMVLKPSPFTPLAVLRLGELLRPLLPAGVLNIITGGDHLGPLMTSHPGFDKIAFTGSTATGRRVMESAAPTLKRITLELGGNDPAIVFPDVDVPAVAEQLFWSAFGNSGQICVATKRAYVHNDIYDDMLTAMREIAATAVMDEGTQQGSLLGPVQNIAQYRRIIALLADCTAQGYQVHSASAPNDGYFVPVTLVDNPPENSRIVQEEQFGPILPLLRFENEADVIQRANATEYGLAATIWTQDEDRARRVADQIEAGSVWINEGLALHPLAAFGGHKQSGIGKENGVAGLLEYTNSKTVTLRRVAPVAQ